MQKHGSWAGLFTILLMATVAYLPLSVSAQEPPQCIAYGYTVTDNHYFLLQNNSIMYNEVLIIKHNCENVEIYLNDDLIHQTSTNSTLYLPEGINNYTITADNSTYYYENVNIIGGSLGWYDDYLEYTNNKPTISEFETQLTQNFVAFFTGIIIWILSVNVYWKLINHYVDRNYFEEVQ